MYKYKIMVEWNDGNVEEIDSTLSEAEACHLVSEYQMAYRSNYKRIWWQF